VNSSDPGRCISRQRLTQCCRRVFDRVTTSIHDPSQADEGVDHSFVAFEFDRDTSAPHLIGVGLALIAKRIALARDHERWREAAHI